MSDVAVFKVTPGIQPYAWGKKGSDSLAAQLGSVCVPDFQIDENETYAELWMGTHLKVPSKVGETKLSDHLRSNPSLIGTNVSEKFSDAQDGSLPFLFKVLSIGTALSIQAHPTKELAKRFFKERPDVYKDDNHKPEMAIALTPFLAFLNFLPLPTILLHLLSVHELDDIIPSSLTSELASSLTLPDTRPPDSLFFTPTVSLPTDDQKVILKKVFSALMSAYTQVVKKSIDALIKRYQARTEIAESERGLVDLALMLNEQYPGDIGILCVFMLNVVELKKGEAAFLSANMPHAYIKGDIIECMATSDNVVRAGLTPKLRDVKTLVEMLTYEAGPATKQLLQPSGFGSDATHPSTHLYDPPIEEFSVLRLSLDAGKEEAHRPINGPSLCVVTEGKGKVAFGDGTETLDFGRGDIIFIGAEQGVKWTAEEDVAVFRAFVEVGK